MKLKFLVDVPDKYTGEQYKLGQIKEFEDKRAKEILQAKRTNGQPFVEIVEEAKEKNVIVKTNTTEVSDKSKKTRKKKQ